MRTASSASSPGLRVHRVGVVHVVDLRGAVDVDDILAVIRSEILDGRARALAIDVPASTSLSPTDVTRITAELDAAGPAGWRACAESEDPGDLARVWHLDGREIRIFRL